MEEKNYLSEEEQYKEILNNKEIQCIKDYKLRKIRNKYWNLRHKAFLDEHGIPDSEIGNVYDKLIKEEQQEIEKYKLSLQEEKHEQ